MKEVLTFDKFPVGNSLGTHSFTIDVSTLRLWRKLYFDEGRPGPVVSPMVSPGVVTMIVMRAYITVLRPAPDGNIHAGLSLEMHKLPEIGHTLTTEITVSNKEVRKGRLWVYMDIMTRDEHDRVICTGKTKSIWAR
jgi:acyl dehydratase